MRKFEDVDIISSLRKIMGNNNRFYQSDFEYDADTLKKADIDAHFLWMSRDSGTYLFNERDVYIRNTYAHQTWRYYDAALDGVKAFAVKVTENEDGRPFGDIYELDYQKHKEEMKQNSFNGHTVDVTFKPTHTNPEMTRRFDVVEYNDLGFAIVQRYGEVESVRYNLVDENNLNEILVEIRKKREDEAVAATVNAYVRDMVKERFHDYGYTRDDMAFTTPSDAYAALKHLIPVYILRRDNTAEKIRNTAEIDKALYDGCIFGMGSRDKRLLNFFNAGNTLADLPFSHRELTTIFHMALDRGKENIEDEQQRKAIDGIIQVLDTVLFADDSRDLAELELDRGLDEGIEQ